MSGPEKAWGKKFASEMASASSLGWELALPIFGGVLLGYYLDRHYGTGYTFTVGLLFLGVFSGFYNVWRFNQRIMKREQRRALRKRAAERIAREGANLDEEQEG